MSPSRVSNPAPWAAAHRRTCSVAAVASVTVELISPDAAYLRSLVDLSQIRPLKVVVDAGNGMGGYTVPAVLGTGAGLDALPLEIVELYFELDGTFPNHEANPLEPENLRDLQAAVLEHGADLGLAFDGDADRCFVIDERGEAVSPSAITAMVATREIAREAAAGTPADKVSIVYNVISSAISALMNECPTRVRTGFAPSAAMISGTAAEEMTL